MTCFCSLKGDSYSLPKKKNFFCFIQGHSTSQTATLGCGGTPVQTDSPTWNCQSPEPVWLSPSLVSVWEGGSAGGPGLRDSAHELGLRLASLALGREPKPAVVLTTKAAAWYIIFLFSYYFILTNCLQPIRILTSTTLSATCSELCSDLDVICAKTHPLSSILRQMMRKTGIWVFSRGASQERKTKHILQKKCLLGVEK